MPAAEHPVFISYSSNDKVAADQICAALETAGYACWIAPRNIEPGAEYPSAILDGLRHARAVVVIVSADAVMSPHILTEISHAFSEKKPIIPFRLSAAELPPDFDYFLSMSQWLDAHDGCTTENLGRLQEAVSQALAGKASVPRKIRSDPRLALTVALLLVAAMGGVFYWRSLTPRIESSASPPSAGNPAPSVEEKKGNPPDTKPQPWVNPKDGLTYVWIPPGSFTMGCSPGDTECKPEESPSHIVEIPSGFWLGRTEVTNAAYHRIQTSSSFPVKEANLPVVGVSRREAKSYCAAIGGRLPTEAEWEYAARGGTAGAYYGVPAKIAWFASNSDGSRHEVATKQPNAYGLYDMLGNASEWVLDRYYNKYDIDAPAIGKVEEPLVPNAEALTRGGFWESEAENIRVSHRIAMENDEPGPMAGIRCVTEKK